MKLFRKLRKKKDDRGDGRPGPTATPEPSATSRPSATPGPSATSEPLPPGAAGRHTMTTRVPPQELGRFLASPASSLPAEEISRLIQIGPKALCPVCYNIDPYQAPQDPDRSATHLSWARAEYDIPAGTPVAKVTIQKSEDLIQSSQSGCFFCTMVATTLGGMHPGYESERSFVDLYLAPGLPVVACLNFGGTGSVKLGAEEARAMGIVLPEGQGMDLVFTISEPSKPGLEVEIYRDTRLAPADPTVADAALARVVEHMGSATEVAEHAGAPECFEFINNNLATCVKGHECGGDGPLPLLPDRVLWIEANNATRIQLVEPKDIRAKYIALSYCWGPTDAQTYLTKASNLAARKSGINYTDLPPLFQDAITCTRYLGVEYLWIDRLCIIQTDGSNFNLETSKMNEIYGNATLTIAAASADSEMDRILVERNPKCRSYNLDMQIDGVGSLPLRVRRRTHELGKESKGGDYGRSSTRALVWQERLLSSRTVFFTSTALKFECRRHAVWEGSGPGVKGHSWSAKLDNVSHTSWMIQVEEYTRRDITRQSDRLPVMETVMKRVAQKKGWSPLWGMWADALVESLCWKSETSDTPTQVLCRMNPAYYAPTWSWASVDGPVSFTRAGGMSSMEAHDPIVYDLEVRSVNAGSGLIRVAGRAVRIKLDCRVEVEEHAEDGERRLVRTYEITELYDTGRAHPVDPDVHLKPWSGTVREQHTTTVVRVPYGEAPPEESWSSDCFCLLVGKMTLRTEALLLGLSPREPTACERMGMVSGLPPALFEGVPSITLDIL